MTLSFKSGAPATGRVRGLSAEAKETYSVAYVGEIEFGSLFQVSADPDEIWRWGIGFPIGSNLDGFTQSRHEAELALSRGYQIMLQRTGLAEQLSERPLAQV